MYSIENEEKSSICERWNKTIKARIHVETIYYPERLSGFRQNVIAFVDFQLKENSLML